MINSKHSGAIALSIFILSHTGCKPAGESASSLMVVNGGVITSEEEAKKHARGAYGVQYVYENAAGDIKRQEATGFFTDPRGTTFITNGHVAGLKPPPGYVEKSRSIVDYQGNVVQTVAQDVETYVNPGATRSDRDLAMWRFPEGTKSLPHGTAEFAPKGYDLKTQSLSVAGYGVNTNSSTETPEYQKMRYGPVGNLSNPTGNTFGYYGPRLDSDPGKLVSSAPGDSGAPIYGTSGAIVGINQGGKNVDDDTSYSQAINPYSPGATSFFEEVQARGGVIQGWGEAPSQSGSGSEVISPEGASDQGISEAKPSQFSGNPEYSDVAQ